MEEQTKQTAVMTIKKTTGKFKRVVDGYVSVDAQKLFLARALNYKRINRDLRKSLET